MGLWPMLEMAYGPMAYAPRFWPLPVGLWTMVKAYAPMAYGPVTAAQPKATGPEIAACCVSLVMCTKRPTIMPIAL